MTFSFENAGIAPLTAGITSLGQVFAQGELPAGRGLVAQIGGAAVPVQVDVKTTWPDGSAKMALLTLDRPALAAGASVDVILAATTASTAPALTFANGLNGRDFTVRLTPQGGAPITIDVVDAIRDAVADGTASLWQSGPLATQARVEILLPNSSQRLVFDVTVYRGGGFEVDAQFNNDRAMEATGGRVVYDLLVTMDGQQVARETVNQAQYQNWHQQFSSNGRDGGQGLGAPDAGWLNIRHDVAKLGALGVVADYDLTLQIPEAELAEYGVALASPNWGVPLAANGVERYMPSAGGRPDLGITTEPNTDWLISGDARAAAYALGQAEAASSVPWHYRDAANGEWLNLENFPRLWTDGRGGTGRPGDRLSSGLTQQREPWSTLGWEPERAHQPDLSFVPYVLTGERWMLDNLNAQASWNLMDLWPFPRQDGTGITVNTALMQTRGAAWAMRTIENAAWAAPDGSFEKAYFTRIADANWAWLVAQLPAWTAQQGEAYGYMPTMDQGRLLAPWQQDYFASTAISAASRGNQDALTFLNWAKNFLIGRFEADARGFNIRDGAAVVINIRSADWTAPFKTWAEIGAATVAAGNSNGNGWGASQGEYARLALATLAGIYELTGDQRAYDAYARFIALEPWRTERDDFAAWSNYAVTIPELFPDATPPPVDYDDVLTLTGPVNGRTYDLGPGHDLLVLAKGTNFVTVQNIEVIRGDTGNDSVTFGTPANNAKVDLGDGLDWLTLHPTRDNVVSIRNVEFTEGGSGNDTVTFETPSPAGRSVMLRGGRDTVILASGKGNFLAMSGVESVVGGAGMDTIALFADDGIEIRLSDIETVLGSDFNDDVILETPMTGGLVDLRDGADHLVLSSRADNRLSVSGVETIIGGAANDDVRLFGGARGVLVDLGGGADRVTLDNRGGNDITVASVETVIGSTGDDRVLLQGAAAAGTVIDLRAGNDVLILSADSNNSVTIIGVETVIGGVRNDWVALGNPAGGGVGAASAPGESAVQISMSGIERVTGSGASELVTFTARVSGARVNLAGGEDMLLLSNSGPNDVTVLFVETVQGGSGDDVVTVAAFDAPIAIDLGAGIDRVVLSPSGGLGATAFLARIETITAGAGRDVVTLTSRASPGTTVDLGAGDDLLILGNAADSITVANTEKVIGAGGSDRIIAQGRQATHLEGNSGNDTLSGAAGADTIEGGSGQDVMTGGDGADQFLFTSTADSSPAAPDTITDFTAGQDLLVFSGMLHGGFAYRGTSEFTASGNSQARLQGSSLTVDVNGDGAAEMQIQLLGGAAPNLSQSSFLWL